MGKVSLMLGPNTKTYYLQCEQLIPQKILRFKAIEVGVFKESIVYDQFVLYQFEITMKKSKIGRNYFM